MATATLAMAAVTLVATATATRCITNHVAHAAGALQSVDGEHVGLLPEPKVDSGREEDTLSGANHF